MRIENQRFADCREPIDGNEYVGCHFDNVWLIYSGGPLPAFEQCAFTRYRLVLEGPAERTLAMLQGMSDPESGFLPIYEQMFPPRPPKA
jgi:hypothetical protein